MADIKRKILIGADPELFLVKDGKYVSAHDRLVGTKEHPHIVERGAVQVDGVAAEFNIDPANSASTFITNCNHVMKQLTSMVGSDVKISIEPTATFDPEYWETLPKETKQLGCNPDYNAWTQDINPPPNSSAGTMRTASGHIHLGWTKGRDPMDPDHFVDCCILAKQLDVFLGAPSLVWDADQKRRTLYGKAGTFRPKPYGIEYRVLSNKWLTNTALMEFVYSSAFMCLTSMFNGGQVFEDKQGELIRNVIDKSEKWWEDRNSPVYHFLRSHGINPPMSYIDPAWAPAALKEENKTPKKTALFKYKSAVWDGVEAA